MHDSGASNGEARSAADRVSAAFAALPIAALVVDASGVIREVSEAARVRLGGGELRGRPLDVLAALLEHLDRSPLGAEDLANLCARDAQTTLAVVGAQPSATVQLTSKHLTENGGALITLADGAVADGSVMPFDLAFREFAERSFDLIAVHERGKLIYANRVTAEVLGYPSALEMIGLPVINLVAPSDREWVSRRIDALYEQRVSVPAMEERLLKRSGEVVPANVTALPFPTPNGQGVVVVAHALTAEKAAEHERERLAQLIQAQLETFENIVQFAPVGIALLRGPELRFELANEAFQALAPGITLARRPFAEAVPAMGVLHAPLEHVQRTREPVSAMNSPFWIPDQAGLRRDFAYAAVPAQSGGADAVLLIVVEMTALIVAQQRIEELSEERGRTAAELAAVLENMVEGVLVLDKNMRVTMINSSARRALHEVTDVVPDRVDADMLASLGLRHRDGRAVTLEGTIAYAVINGGRAAREDYVISDGSEQHVIRASVSPIASGDRVLGAVMVVSDVTAEARLERAKTSFIRMAAHELKTPITVMKGYAQALKLHKGGITSERAVDAIIRGTNRIDRVVRDLLDVSAFEMGSIKLVLRPFRLDAMIQEAVERTRIEHPGRDFVIETISPLSIVGDRERLAQVLGHLLDNAARFSPRNTSIVVGIHAEVGWVQVSVSDQGIGIPEEKQDHVFEPYYRAHDDTSIDYGGIGVGLYISRRIMLQHGGRLGFESKEGRGSRFWFRLAPIEAAAP